MVSSSEGGGFNMKALSFQNRRSFESFGYYDRSKQQRHSFTPGSCPTTSQAANNQVDMFGFGSGFDEEDDFFSLKTPAVVSDLSLSRDNSYQSP